MNIKTVQKSVLSQLSPFLGEGEARAVVNLLLRHYTTYNSLYINLNPFTEIDQETIERINKALKELLEDKPIQYVLGETVFCNLPFMVDNSVLIPRPETEELTSWIIEENHQARRLMDICTGSGCIAVSLANYIRGSRVYAVEISRNAIEVANRNASLNKVKVDFIQHDVLDPDFSDFIDDKFDVIVSNPPYVRTMEKMYMHKRVLDYEPEPALFVEDDNPLLFYDAILKFGQTHLMNNGKLYFEINEHFGKEVVYLYKQYGYTEICLKRDIHGKDRMVSGKMKTG